MQFLRTLFWVLLAAAAMLFSFSNWTPVTVNLWSGLQLDTRLPLLLFGAFLVGLIPGLLLHRATRWSMGRKISSMERVIADATAPAQAPPSPSSGAIPPGAAPIAVPPGVS